MNTLNLLSDSKYFDESNTKMAELRTLLDSKHMKEKLDAMKRLTAMMSIGRDMSAFFPDVVRNVIVDSQEVKKLVYMFLIAYAETNQDLALLSINTFQKDLASPSQRIRASAMKAMSSIRIPVAVPLVTLALKSAIKDTSSYVKRAAACAIPKVYALDTEQEEMLVEMITELLSNSDPLVIGPAMYAFQEVCPNNWDLIHPHFRKIVHLIADFDEWGQIVTINVLTRYARTQFLSPFDKEMKEDAEQAKNPGKPKKERAFYSDDEESEEDEEEEEEKEETDEYVMDEDHSLLLKQTASLLQSPNTGVILALASMYWNLAPSHQCAQVVKPLVRMSRNRRSLQFVILHAIVSMAAQRPVLFRPFLKDFFIHTTDAYYVKALKLEILASIATEASIHAILKEFNAYAHDPDKEFVCQTLQALGRCANALPEIAERCMGTLMKLVTSPSEQVVAQAVVTIRQLLQNNADLHGSVVKKIAKLLDKVKIPMARTAIVWIIGEYRDKIPLLAPDCLRLLCKTFKEENDSVKEQILNLAVKLFLSNPKQTSLLFKYIMDLCKFDLNYDLRDRARLMRSLFFKKKDANVKELPAQVKDALKGVLLTEKPAPIVIAPFAGREKYLLGTMSHTLNIPVPGYTDLPEFPKEQPDPTVRKPIVPEYEQDQAKKDKKKHRGSDSDSESASGDSDDSEFSSFNSESDSDSDSDSDSGSGSGSDSGSASDSDDDGKAKTKKKKADSDDDSESGSDDDSDSDDSDDGGAAKKKAKALAAEKAKEKERAEKAAKEKAKEEEQKRKKDEKDKKKKGGAATAAPIQSADLLDLQGLDDSSALSSASSTQRDMTPLDTFFTPSASSSASQIQSPTSTATETLSPSSATALSGLKQPALGQRGQLLNPINSGGLQIDYIMSRKPSLYDKKMVAIDLLLLNQSTAPFDEISMSEETTEASGDSRGLDEVGARPLNVGESAECKIHVNFKGKPMPRQLVVTIKGIRHVVKMTPSVGELVRPFLLSWTLFSEKQKKLGGMSEHQLSVNVNDINAIPQRIIDAVNVAALAIPTGTTDVYRFAGQSLHDDSSLLIQVTIKKRDDSNNNKGATQIVINHDDFLFASNMTDTVKKAIAQ